MRLPSLHVVSDHCFFDENDCRPTHDLHKGEPHRFSSVISSRYPSWVSYCAFWPDDGHPLYSAHCVRNRAPPIRFDAISQFAASVLYSGTSLVSPLLSASFCWLQIWFLPHCHMRHCMGRVWQCSACAKLPLIFTLSLPSFLGFFHLLFVLAPGLLRVYCWCLLEQFALA